MDRGDLFLYAYTFQMIEVHESSTRTCGATSENGDSLFIPCTWCYCYIVSQLPNTLSFECGGILCVIILPLRGFHRKRGDVIVRTTTCIPYTLHASVAWKTPTSNKNKAKRERKCTGSCLIYHSASYTHRDYINWRRQNITKSTAHLFFEDTWWSLSALGSASERRASCVSV